jgi:hypothetical protein
MMSSELIGRSPKGRGPQFRRDLAPPLPQKLENPLEREIQNPMTEPASQGTDGKTSTDKTGTNDGARAL